MKYNKLGKTEIDVSVVAMGCWAIVGDFTWGHQDEQDAVEAIETALDSGVNFFDTAESYGDGYSEELLGRTLDDIRQDVVIASKVSPSNLSPKKLKKACESSLRRLKSDYIDLYQIHWPNHDVPIADTIETMNELQDEGKIRAAGCSNFGPQDLSAALNCGRLESNQVAYNLLWRGIEYHLMPMCVENEVSILPYSPLAQGLLTGKFNDPDEVPPERARTRHFSNSRQHTRHGGNGAEELTFDTVSKIKNICNDIDLPMAQVALAYALTQPAVTSVISGMRNAEQARQNAMAGDLHLADNVIMHLQNAAAELKAFFGPAMDMWQSEERTG